MQERQKTLFDEVALLHPEGLVTGEEGGSGLGLWSE
jgi:hypothetical protein